MDPVGEIYDDLPLPPYVSAEDVVFALRAISVHTPEQRPDGQRCRKDQAAHPCRLHRWGRHVLQKRGLTGGQIQTLLTGGTVVLR
ncbi:hypothetical protein C7C45_04705 [Micromonospora arborensis]|uniref:Uncharacterized protein n=1 Tax=Micromonospora arborensis TaxID=2116518 RepID=A0A318NPC5_9ACTN|nr:hypothetical protein [Micromonospora arborensis]PYC75174.1 hypothetical protein C7C45_04705 [Micromonospora arborensis]